MYFIFSTFEAMISLYSVNLYSSSFLTLLYPDDVFILQDSIPNLSWKIFTGLERKTFAIKSDNEMFSITL